jgi:hypothetical protein
MQRSRDARGASVSPCRPGLRDISHGNGSRDPDEDYSIADIGLSAFSLFFMASVKPAQTVRNPAKSDSRISTPQQQLKGLQAVALPQLLDHLIETGLQCLWGDRVEHQTNVVVCRNLLHPE